MTPADRQRARERAADAVAEHHQVIVPPGGWPPPARYEPGLCYAERQRRYRASKKAAVR